MGFVSCHITSLVIYNLKAHTHTHMNMHTNDLQRINFKKPGTPAFGRHASYLESFVNYPRKQNYFTTNHFHTEISNNEFFPNMNCHVYNSNVTGFGRIQLPCTQQQNTILPSHNSYAH